jgi:hypothetical protein
MQQNAKNKKVPTVQYLSVSGMLLAGNQLVVRPSYLTTNSHGSTSFIESPIQIDLYHDEKRLLRWGVTIRPNISFRNHKANMEILNRIQSGMDPLSFRAKVPYRIETTRIVFLFKGEVLHEIKVPINGPFFKEKPTIKKISKEEYLLSWHAEHPGAIPLFFHVRTSADGGKTWIRLASRLRQSELRVFRDSIAGGKNCILEVVAYDGVNTTNAQVKVPDAPPIQMVVIIIRPSSNEELYSPIELQAFAQVRGRPDIFVNQIEFNWYIGEKKIADGPVALWNNPPLGEHTLIIKTKAGEYGGMAHSKIIIRDINKK